MSTNGDTPLKYLTGPDKLFFLTIAPTAPHDAPQLAAVRRRHMPTCVPDAQVPSPTDGNFNPPDQYQRQKVAWVKALEPISQLDIRLVDVTHKARLRTLLADHEMVEDVVKLFGDKWVLDKTYVIYTTHNGYHLRNHRIFGGGPALSRRYQSASYQFTPTLLEIAGVAEEAPPPYLNGCGLLSHWHAPERPVKSCPYDEAQEIINVKFWRPNQAELHDTAAEPYVLTNLALRPDAVERLAPGHEIVCGAGVSKSVAAPAPRSPGMVAEPDALKTRLPSKSAWGTRISNEILFCPEDIDLGRQYREPADNYLSPESSKPGVEWDARPMGGPEQRYAAWKQY
ncbi:hypothetical protein DL770_002753 [Monosporascus sp. CRB-9-2]|nr:hypothetical protein DL770_002753 [Monosporascus sp. CRB-9-2]